MEIAAALKNHPRIQVRMGIHSGPVDRVKDVNDRINIAGVGMNIAQRVMDLGDGGHILLTHRIAADLSEDAYWHQHLHDLGEVEVKHGTKVGIANLYTEDVGNPQPPEKIKALEKRTFRGRRSPRLMSSLTPGKAGLPLFFWCWRSALAFGNFLPGFLVLRMTCSLFRQRASRCCRLKISAPIRKTRSSPMACRTKF